jgi:hypothetical protein
LRLCVATNFKGEKEMTNVTFIANGKSFKTYAEARAVSKFVDVSYTEHHYEPTGTPENRIKPREKRSAAYAPPASF